ncbi:MAG TPA: Asp23/Gls24 family envelope stress response protein [Natronosporangium sp.]
MTEPHQSNGTEPTTTQAVPAQPGPAEAGRRDGLLDPAAMAAAAERAEVVMDRAGQVANQAAERAGEAIERAAAASGRVATAVVDRLRNDAEVLVDRGTTRIEDEVVEKIAGIAAREVPGVHDLGGDAARFFASVKERVGLGETGEGTRGVSARLEGKTARITVTLVVDYGTQVLPVTEQVRAKVIEAVERMLDLQVTEVNIVVDDVAPPK